MNEIVGACPVCHCPIYGRRAIPVGSYDPCLAIPTCPCGERLRAKIEAQTDLLHAQAQEIRSGIGLPE